MILCESSVDRALQQKKLYCVVPTLRGNVTGLTKIRVETKFHCSWIMERATRPTILQ